jgi:hypothetical protein
MVGGRTESVGFVAAKPWCSSQKMRDLAHYLDFRAMELTPAEKACLTWEVN